jgi:hypothetical protein
VNQASRRKVPCKYLWIRGLECFRPLFFDDESLIKYLNIILSGQRDFLNAVESPKVTLPIMLQAARLLADCARPLAHLIILSRRTPSFMVPLNTLSTN